jgi:pimeloyl-ACP methyl ester carboxylesterase
MTAEAVEYRETGAGPTVVLAPGSCSTGAAWRPVLAHLDGLRTITTSLPGYGGTAERRTGSDRSIAPVAAAVEEVIDRAGGEVHLVGHSFGGLAALALALRGLVPLLSLTIFEAPAPGALIGPGESAHLAEFRAMTDAYAADHHAGKADAIGTMIDFYGGAGSWARMPEAVRDYAAATTAVNLIDWENAYGFELGDRLSSLCDLPVCVAVGANSHSAVIRANALIAQRIPGASFETIAGAAHFMIATHPEAVATLIKRQVAVAGGQSNSTSVIEVGVKDT